MVENKFRDTCFQTNVYTPCKIFLSFLSRKKITIKRHPLVMREFMYFKAIQNSTVIFYLKALIIETFCLMRFQIFKTKP